MGTPDEKKIIRNFFIDWETDKRLRAVSKRLQIPASAIIRMALEDCLVRIEKEWNPHGKRNDPMAG
mgnify:CR=1 FL=1